MLEERNNVQTTPTRTYSTVGPCHTKFGWLVVWGLTDLWDSISVYIGPSPRENEKE